MRVRLHVLLIFTLAYCTLFAQDKPTEIGRISDAIDSTRAGSKLKILPLPVIALSTETSWVFGFGGALVFKTAKDESNLRLSTIPILFLYTLKDQIIVGTGANIFLPKERYIIRIENSYSKFPDKFWGIGNDTPESAEENYIFSQFSLNTWVSRKVRSNLFLGAGFEYQSVFKIQYDSGGNFEKDQVIGVYNRSNYQVFGPSALITYDSRNHTFVPSHGSLLRVKFSKFSTNLGSDYEFHLVDIDFRKFIELKSNHILSFQGYGLFTFGDVPYRNLGSLGGNQMMRGYYGGRYRDKMYLTAQTEYRFPIYRRFGGVAFASMGQVADNFSELGFSKFHYAGGVGIRFTALPKEKLNMRFDVGYGNRMNFYITVFESF